MEEGEEIKNVEYESSRTVELVVIVAAVAVVCQSYLCIWAELSLAILFMNYVFNCTKILVVVDKQLTISYSQNDKAGHSH